ncbi:ComEA family DNA-binding protein [Dyadobacter sandarakinus]|uniref:Helix-hairpin-helix domain-containing protein n=1 Tax=Dyadobacter sandarakinus TaxID=2747268 RepID=A0ABX7I9U1_9BACT|nr:helix-hairpin-helix domain-containing protein [Dyadobacter sandarakinus]QRR02750.1 helix-hairpin-helix domain-containing protein [Dyadobacter sandarakinus]
MPETYPPAYAPKHYLFAGLLCIAGWLSGLHCHGQEPPCRELDINRFLQDILPAPSEDTDYSALYESLVQLYGSPLDLNTASRDELAATFILSEAQLNAFFDYKLTAGPLLSLYELQAVPGFSLTTIYRLLPFVTVSSRQMPFRESLAKPTQHFLMVRGSRDIEKAKGFMPPTAQSKSRYAGPPAGAFLRYRYARSGAYSLGFTMDKDPGEKWMYWNARRQIFVFDFTSFHFQLQNRKWLKNLILGDFQVQAGQGMVLAAGFSLGKGTEVIRTTYRSTLGLKPYTSGMESNFFRGIAATIALGKKAQVTTFYSALHRDGTEDEAPDDAGKKVITSLPVTGYHRTPTELAKHNNLTEYNAGVHLLHPLGQHGQLGMTLLHTAYGLPLQKKQTLYNQYEFTGKRNLTAGIHGDYRYRNLHFSGEAGWSGSGGLGLLAGVIASIGRMVDVTLLLRHYDKDFHSFYGNSFAEGSRPVNESGGYAALRYMPARQWQLSLFFDQFRFPSPRFQADAPSCGHDYMVHALWKPSKRFNAFASFHRKTKMQNPPDKAPENHLLAAVRNTFTCNMEYEVPMKVAFRTRVQAGSVRLAGKSEGFAAAQDIGLHLHATELSLRMAYFHTDNYDSRQYMYEKDVLYAFAIPAYYDKGFRYYLMARYNLTKNVKCWLRWSQTRFAHLDKISSGLNEIIGKRKSEIKAQIIYQL